MIMQYEQLLEYVLHHGKERRDRTGTGTLSVFGEKLVYDVSEYFPLITTKKMHFKSILHELLWFISGNTNIKYLNDNGVTIWNEWADENGDLGPVYGKQWRAWVGSMLMPKIDQLQDVIDQIKSNPTSRRLIVSAWNVTEIQRMALPPCHVMYQFYVDDDKLSIQVYQRSADLFLGVPFNIASYTILLYMIAQQCDLKPYELHWVGGDCHLYLNHIKQAEELLSRKPYEPPKLIIKRKPNNIDDYKYEDFELVNYQCHPAIKADIAI